MAETYSEWAEKWETPSRKSGHKYWESNKTVQENA